MLFLCHKKATEREVKVGRDGAFVLVHTNVEEVDTDGDGLKDGTEKYLYTDPTRFDLAESSFNWVGNDGIFCSSLISEEFANGSWLTVQLYLGNGLFNFKVDFAKDYKLALLEYISAYSEATLQNDVLEAMKEMYESECREVAGELSSWLQRFAKITGESSEYYKAINTIEECNRKLVSYEKTLKSIRTYAELTSFDDELLDTYNNIYVQTLEFKSTLSQATNTAENIDVIEGLTDRVGKVVGNVPSRFNKALELFGKAGDAFGYAGIAIETGGEVYDTIQLYSSLSVEASQYAYILELLDAIVENSDNIDMRMAAQEVKLILENDVIAFLNEVQDIRAELRQGASKAAVTFALAKMGPWGFAIDLGLAFGDFIANTGEITEKSLNTVALGDAASAYAKYVKAELVKDTEDYYFINDVNYSQIQLLGQLRINGEDSFCETADSRGVIMKFIDSFKNGSQEEIEEYCKDTIQRVIGVCDKVGVYVTMDFEGAFLK